MRDDAIAATQQTAILYLDIGALAVTEMRDAIGKIDNAKTAK